jgi:hypothetical protein
MARQYSQPKDSLIGVATRLRSAFSASLGIGKRFLLDNLLLIYSKHISYHLVL